MRYEITPEHPNDVPELIAHIEGVSGRVRGLVAQIMYDAVEAGRKVAEAEAPRGNILEHDEGGRISDSIQVEKSDLARGGVGGGSAYTTVRLYASGLIAPHLRYVTEGTADEGAGKIYPARGNVFAIQKEGEEVKFRRWVHGQRPQTAWWEHAHETVEAEMEAGFSRLDVLR